MFEAHKCNPSTKKNCITWFIKRTTEKVIGHEIRPEDMSIVVIIGYAILEAIEATLNKNF